MRIIDEVDGMDGWMDGFVSEGFVISTVLYLD